MADGVVRRLQVWMDGVTTPAGALEGLAGKNYPIRFTYSPDYHGPPLSAAMPRRAEPYEDGAARVFFDNLLPEGPQRTDIRPGEGRRPVDVEDVSALLEVVGGECPGAVSVLPETDEPRKQRGSLDLDYDRLTEAEVGRLLAAAAQGRTPGRRLRFSLAGVQRKIALAIDPATGEFLAPGRDGIPTTHLLKVEAAGEPETRGLVRNELLCLRLAAALGLPTAEAEAREIGGIPTLVVCRYDRRIEGRHVRRLHQEDAAQALGLDRTEKYEDDARRRGKEATLSALVARLAELTAEPADARDLLRRAAWFNWLVGNNDAHAKNFALLYPEGTTRPTIAPLYDIVSIEALPIDVREMAMSIAGQTRGDEVDRAGIEWLASLDAKRVRVAGSARRARIEAFRDMAGRVLPALDDLVARGEFGRAETKPIRDVVAHRIRRANEVMGWDIDAEGDTPGRRGGGWL